MNLKSFLKGGLFFCFSFFISLFSIRYFETVVNPFVYVWDTLIDAATIAPIPIAFTLIVWWFTRSLSKPAGIIVFLSAPLIFFLLSFELLFHVISSTGTYILIMRDTFLAVEVISFLCALVTWLYLKTEFRYTLGFRILASVLICSGCFISCMTTISVITVKSGFPLNDVVYTYVFIYRVAKWAGVRSFFALTALYGFVKTDGWKYIPPVALASSIVYYYLWQDEHPFELMSYWYGMVLTMILPLFVWTIIEWMIYRKIWTGNNNSKRRDRQRTEVRSD